MLINIIMIGNKYWWNPETNETTAIGAYKPDSIYNNKSIIIDNNNSNHIQSRTTTTNPNPFYRKTLITNNNNNTSFLGSMMTYVTLGVGMTLGMIVVKSIFGM